MNKHRRKTTHRLSRRLSHRLTRRLTYGPCGPNYARQAVIAIRRYIKLHRRLMKLAPDVFDYSIEMKLRHEREEQERFTREIEPLLRKVYGSDENPENAPNINGARCKKGAEKVQNPFHALSPARRRRVEELCNEKALWMNIGSEAMDNLKTQQPQRLLSFPLICGLLDVGITLGRIATGSETNLKQDPHEQLYRRDVNADLEKIYGPTVTPNNALVLPPELMSQTRVAEAAIK
ncbi:MAG: hypothetical protein H0X66_18445 [Verrucomicrobia bacterium]|nr:hypothetical protein [Verrucomicrobiota bacterium]